MDAIAYAAYGSNLHPRRLQARAPTARLIGTGYLPDWSLHFHKRSVDTSGKCSLLQGSSGAYVAVFRMSAADKAVLDRIEGVGDGYRDARLLVPGIGECATYLAAESHIDDALMPYDWYREMVLLGCHELGLAAGYVRAIEQVATVQDPDPVRRCDNWKIVETLRDGVRRKVDQRMNWEYR